MSELIVTLYGLLGVAMGALVVIRVIRGLWIAAVTAALWGSLVWRVGARYAVQRGGYDLGWFGDLLAWQPLVAAQLFALLTATVFTTLWEWEHRR